MALALDSLICIFSVWLAFYLRLGEYLPLSGAPALPALTSVVLALPLFVIFGLYRAIFRYADKESVTAIVRAVALYSIPFTFIYTLIGVDGVPRTVGLIQPILMMMMIGTSRTVTRLFLYDGYAARRHAQDLPQVLIYGAGSAGRQLANVIALSGEMKLAGFIDDSSRLHRATMLGVPIHSPDQLEQLVAKLKVSEILLAIPSAARARRAEIVQQLRRLNLKVRTVPSFVELAQGNLTVNDLRNLEIEDLLGRAAVPPDQELLRKNLVGNVVLVTGAGGSIGSELCRQVLQAKPAALLLFESSEFNLYALHQELSEAARRLNLPEATVIPLLGSVQDEKRIDQIMAKWRPRTVFHAAAYKHVPLVEHNVVEGIRNNVLGTLVVARAARQYAVANFTLVSTDKAVRPTNIMGATKRLAEMILQGLQQQDAVTCFSMVRFGNVLGSSGSVVPLFRRQLAAGGPLTVTHKDITRYFMTISEAAQLVLQAGAMAHGGDVFLLDMGEPVRVFDLARNIIELSGLTVRDEINPRGDIEIRVTGLRPGEKLYEELLIAGTPTPTDHPRILRSHETFLPFTELLAMLNALSEWAGEGKAAEIREALQTLVPDYKPNSTLVDWVATQPEPASPPEQGRIPRHQERA